MSKLYKRILALAAVFAMLSFLVIILIKLHNRQFAEGYHARVASGDIVRMEAWFNEEYGYCIALPSMANEFCVEGEWYSCEFLQNGEMVVGLKDGSSLNVFRSQNLNALFIDVKISQDELDAIHGERYGGVGVLYCSNGEKKGLNGFEYIKTRGNSTYMREKKPYEIGLKYENELVDNVKAKKWVLLANDMDSTLIKNSVVYDYINEYLELPTTKGDFVDLYINGDYRGNYYLCEKVQENGQVVDVETWGENEEISEIADDNIVLGYDEDETAYGYLDTEGSTNRVGGYIVEFVDIDQIDAEHPYFVTDSGAHAKVKYPKNASLEQVVYIRDEFNELEEACYSSDGINRNTGKNIEEYIDIESYVGRYLVENIFQNFDSGLASSYFYKANSTGKIYAGPLWDYDLIIDYMDTISLWDTEIVGRIYLSDAIFQHTSALESFRELYYNKGKPYVKYCMAGLMYKTNERIKTSKRLNSLRWDVDLTGDELNIDNLLLLTNERLEVIEEKLLGNTSYCTVQFCDAEGRAIWTGAVKKGNHLDYVPNVTSWIAIFNGWIRAEDGKWLTPDTIILEDSTFESQWLPMEAIVLNGIQMADISVDDVSVEDLENMIEIIKDLKKETEYER